MADHLREDIVRLAHGGASLDEFSVGAARIITRAVPCDGVCVLDGPLGRWCRPASTCATGCRREAFGHMAEIEHSGEDINAFRTLALAGRGAAA